MTSAAPQSNADVWQVTPADVATIRHRFEDALLIDCRTQLEFQNERVRGAQLLPLQEITSRMSELNDWRSRVILIYCNTGRRSRILARFLAHRGFACVRSVAGGIEAWKQSFPEDCILAGPTC